MGRRTILKTPCDKRKQIHRFPQIIEQEQGQQAGAGIIGQLSFEHLSIFIGRDRQALQQTPSFLNDK